MQVVMVGAGIGGLTLGIALGRAGHEVTIFEKRSHFKEEGAGRWFRDLAVRLTPAGVNERALRRIVMEMPGVPLSNEKRS